MISVGGLCIICSFPLCLLCPPCLVPLAFPLLLQQFLLPLRCLRSAHLPVEVDPNASTWRWLPQDCLKVEALQETLSWGLPTPAMLSSHHFHSGFVVQHNCHCPEQGQRTPREAARAAPSTHTTQVAARTRDSGGAAVACALNAATSQQPRLQEHGEGGQKEPGVYGEQYICRNKPHLLWWEKRAALDMPRCWACRGKVPKEGAWLNPGDSHGNFSQVL